MQVFDRLINLVSGLGGQGDKASHTRFGGVTLDKAQLTLAYRSDWIARKIVDIPAKDALRAGRDWQAKSVDIGLIEETEKRLGFQRKALKTYQRARLYGGAGLVIGVAGQEGEEPLDPADVQKDGLTSLYPATMDELTVSTYNLDPASDRFGEPEYYTFNPLKSGSAGMRLHASRVVRMVGTEMLEDTGDLKGWGDSVLQSVADAIKAAGVSQQAVSSLLQEAKIDVVRVKNLHTSLATKEYSDLMIKRYALAGQLKSLTNTLLLDADEEWDQKQVNFATLPDIMDRFLQAASGAADIPATRMLGQSPAGMSATGESDLENYYGRIGADQELVLRPAFSILDECIIRSALGDRPEDVHYTWSPLWTMSEKDQAEIAHKKAQAVSAYSMSGLIPGGALSKATINMITEDGFLPGLEAAMVDMDADMLGDD